MFSSQERKILHLLGKTEYITATELAEALNIGVKTVRTRIKELNPRLSEKGITILSKPRYGYYVDAEKREQMEDFLNQEAGAQPEIPSTTQDRTNYLLAYLLNQKDYIKSETLCEFLYISKGTLTNTLRQVEEVYQRYHISIDKKPNYGIKVRGREFDLRQCMMDVFVKKDGLEGVGRRYQTKEIQTLGNMVYQCIQKFDIEFSEISYNDFVEHIYIALRRIRQEKYVEPSQVSELGMTERQFTEELVRLIEEKYQIAFPQVEKDYLALQLAGKSIVKDGGQGEDNFVIQSEVDEVADRMLDMIYREFQIDFRQNLELKMTLNRHLVPLSIRLKYRIFLRNPMLEEIKKNYFFAYTIASQAAAILKEYYESEISEDDIGELAEIFELALEQMDSEKKQFSILIVCASGKSSSQLLKYRYSREFKENIREIYVCNLYEAAEFDFSKVDYVFATVPIHSYVPVPILEVSSFLKETDIAAVRKLFHQGSKEFLRKYYRRELFFTDIEGTSREEVLRGLCERTAGRLQEDPEFCRAFQRQAGSTGRNGKIENGKTGNEETCFSAELLYRSVLNREELSPTDYGNLVAIPHPDRTFFGKTAVAVAVLEKPVFWAREKVQVIILTIIGSGEDADIQKFYEATTDLLLRQEDVSELIKRKSFEVMLGLLRK